MPNHASPYLSPAGPKKFEQIRPRPSGWQLLPQSIKSRVHRINLKKIIIIAGPNGAGKTTFARDFLPAEAQTLRFINADLIAAGLANFHELYSKVVDSWAFYDSSGIQPKLIDWSNK